MTNTYNTLNPMGSTSPKDLYDNASNFDEGMNSLNPSFKDRFARRRETWSGMEVAFQTMLDSFGFVWVADYVDGVPGIVLTARNQYIVRAGVQYHLAPMAPLPYTTTGNWATDQTSFLAFTDDGALRLDLANNSDPLKGAALIGYQGAPLPATLIALAMAVAAVGSYAVANTVATLRAGAPTAVQFQLTSGYYGQGDTGGNALYRRIPSDTTSADDGGSILVDVNNVRWYLIHNGTVNAEWFGVRPDGATNMVTQLNTAIALPSVREIKFGPGPYFAQGNIGMLSSKTLTGIPGGGTTVNISGAGTIVLFQQSRVSGFSFQCAGQAVGNWLFDLSTNTGGFEYVTLEDIYTYNCKGFITDDNHATNKCTNIRIRNISNRLMKGPGMLLRNAWAFLECRDIAIDFVGNTAAQNYTGFSVSNNQGCLFDNCEMTGTTGLVAGTSATQIGFSFTNCLAVYLRRCFGDTCGGKGIYASACGYVRLVMCTTVLCDDTPLYLIACTDVQITNHYAAGRRGLAGATGGIPAIYLNACTGVMIGNADVLNASGDGILTAANTTQLAISGSRMVSNGSRGLTTGAGSVSITTGCVFANNVVANYSLATSVDHLSGCQASSGALLNVTGPGAA